MDDEGLNKSFRLAQSVPNGRIHIIGIREGYWWEEEDEYLLSWLLCGKEIESSLIQNIEKHTGFCLACVSRLFKILEYHDSFFGEIHIWDKDWSAEEISVDLEENDNGT